MPVYAYRMIEEMRESLKKLGESFFAKTPLVLTGDEFIAAFIDPDHVAKIREVQSLVGFAGSSGTSATIHTSSGVVARVGINFNLEAPLLVPQYVRNGLQPTCPDELRDKITRWADERYSYGTAFGDALDAITWLNETCGDLRAMSVMLPCIVSVVSNITDDAEHRTAKRARKLTEQNRFGKLPKLPGPVKQRLMEVSALVNATTLVKDAPMPVTRKHDAMVAFRGDVNAPTGRTNIFYSNVDPSRTVPVASFL